MNIPDGLPILSRGSHSRASGRACIMNAISYLKGDISITDAPDCVAQIIRFAFISVNDRMCHTKEESLCSQCSHLLWLKGIGTVGTAESWAALDEKQQSHLSHLLVDAVVNKNPYLSQSQRHDIMGHAGKLIVGGNTPSTTFETVIDQVTFKLLLEGDILHFEKTERASWVLETIMRIFDSYTLRVESVELNPDQFALVVTEAKVPVHANAH